MPVRKSVATAAHSAEQRFCNFERMFARRWVRGPEKSIFSRIFSGSRAVSQTAARPVHARGENGEKMRRTALRSAKPRLLGQRSRSVPASGRLLSTLCSPSARRASGSTALLPRSTAIRVSLRRAACPGLEVRDTAGRVRSSIDRSYRARSVRCEKPTEEGRSADLEEPPRRADRAGHAYRVPHSEGLRAGGSPARRPARRRRACEERRRIQRPAARTAAGARLQAKPDQAAGRRGTALIELDEA